MIDAMCNDQDANSNCSPNSVVHVVISSSLFPRYNRNLNSGEEIYSAKTPRVAKNKVYFSGDYPTQIILPIMNIE